MKELKLFYVILIGIIILSSCSSNDDSNSNSIIGIWKPIKEVGVCQDKSEQVDEYSICEQDNDRLTFNTNGMFNGTHHQVFNGNCQQVDSYSGTWGITNGKLFITENGIKDQVGVFELTSNILKLGSIEENPFDDPCSPTVGLSHYYTEYIRVE